MSAKPTVESLKIAAVFAANSKGATPFDVIAIAGAFDAYLAGVIEALPAKVAPDEFQVNVKLKRGGKPVSRTDQHSAGCTESVACDVGNPVPSLRAFTRTLTDEELGVVADSGMPYWAERLLKTAAHGEIKRRRDS